MSEFRYKASDMSGKIKSGTATAQNEDILRQNLLNNKLYLIECDEINQMKIKRLKGNQLSDFCLELSSMLGAGVSLIRAMSIIIDRDIPQKQKNVFIALNTQLKRGIALSDAMTALGNTFPELLINMVRSGEASGKMEDTLRKMAVHYDKEYKLNSEIKSAMTYPMILVVMTLLVIIAVFTFIFPRFMSLFEGMELPPMTQFMIGISDLFTKRWYLVIVGAVALAAGIIALRQVYAVRRFFDLVKIRIPKIGRLTRIIYTARFARTLSSLYSSGLSIINSLSIAKDTIGNRYITEQFDKVQSDVRAGVPLSEALMQIDGFDRKLAQSIVVGEETGRLDTMLDSIADNFEFESSAAIKKIVKLIEPIMIVIMAIIIVTVILSVLTPIYDMYNNIESMG